jgi:hypothetical protein
MTVKDQTPEMDHEAMAIQNMISEGGLGAAFYYQVEQKLDSKHANENQTENRAGK